MVAGHNGAMSDRAVRGVVTLSASYGAGGGPVGRMLAERLGLPFFDRAIPVEVAQRMAVSLETVLAHDEKAETGMERFLTTMARLAVPLGPDPVVHDVGYSAETYKEQTEAVLRRVADTTGGVVLGRAGMLVLRGRPDVLSVRLDGPVAGRIARVMALEGIDEATARERQAQTDRARDAYVKSLYGARQDDPRLYHLILDSTVLELETCTDLIELAARARLGSRKPGWG